MVQYEMYFTNEYTEDIILDLSKTMGVSFRFTDIEKAINEKDIYSKNNLIVIQNDTCLICVDCNNLDYIYPFDCKVSKTSRI